MSAYVLEREILLALVRTAVEGPAGQDISPDSVWHGVRWFSVDDVTLAELDWTTGRYDMVRRESTYEHAADIAGMLYDENIASVRRRYADADSSGMVTDEPAFTAHEVKFDGRRLPVPVALGALDCYEYQACEHPEWNGSEARRFCDAFRRALCARVAGYTWNVREVVA